jgi:hypothetical protein
MEISELRDYLETEVSKKMIKLLSKIMKSYNRERLYQTITIYNGDDVNYYFSETLLIISIIENFWS